MIIPIRCFTCGTPIAHKWEEYCKRTGDKEDAKEVLDSLGFGRYCCRRMFLSQSETVGEVMKYRKY